MMIVQRRKVVVLLFLFIIFQLAVLSVPAAAKSVDDTHIEIEEFISGFVDMAAIEGTPEAVREKLFETALGFADIYSSIKKDSGAFHRKIKERIGSLLPGEGASEKKERELSSEELYDAMIEEQGYTTRVLVKVEEFTMRTLRSVLVYKDHSIEEGESLELIFGFAKTYSEVWGDSGSFHRRIEHIVSTLPPADISLDEDIIVEFQQAIQHENSLAKEFLVEKIRSRIEPFLNEIIDMAIVPIQTPVKKETLLVTAMNMAKTYGDMTGEHSIHRRIHRKVFTARLSKPIKSELIDNVHIVDVPKAKRRMINKFVPDNIKIRTGETVRWVNFDKISHVIGTFDFLSDGHFFEPNLNPGEKFEYTFNEAGEYYYICYIHRSMIGKILVEE
jgi:plastocyanin